MTLTTRSALPCVLLVLPLEVADQNIGATLQPRHGRSADAPHIGNRTIKAS
jgi:hypothetical protein